MMGSGSCEGALVAKQSTAVPTMGPLERQAMEVLWSRAQEYLQVRDVCIELDSSLAYTTVMTLLVRLTTKGLLTRRRRGRAYAYRPRISRSDYAARAMVQTMEDASDVPDVLLRFVDELSEEQQAALRDLLEE
ncbi:MAG: BlaI/MecI/CopY family transcriptional regulator [Actinobacteria bacterium]|nr:BlaI/MecI/CopY family transcriptional regulator [Actinomycetota bacterium]